MNKKFLLHFLLIFYLSSCSLPNAVSDDFEGKFVYTVKSPGNTPNPNDSINYQIVYAKDSMLRIDNFTPIGKQIYIKHIPKNRAYILMDLGVKKVAIQTIPDTLKDDDKYIFEHKAGASRFAGLKGKNIKVTDTEQDTTIIMNYSPTISPKYTTALKNIPGLPLKYALFSNGTWIQYKLIEMEEKTIDIDLFGIPSDHEIITLDEFIDIIKE